MDWQSWHEEYDRPDSYLARRLGVVQERIRLALDAAAPGPVRVISLCAGQGRDLLPVLAEHPRRDDVRARLVELDPRNTAAARTLAEAARLEQVDVVTGDAALIDHYQGMTPADLVLACGIFGNVSDDDIKRTVGFCPRLCAAGATVIWTRHRGAPDRVPLVCAWFEEVGLERQWLSDPAAGFGVGVHRFTGEPQTLGSCEQMFRFVGYDKLRSSSA
ncbi:class I SAM-dependent methyltransferase family protein [Nonomuraea sp. NPDC002799]